MIISISGPRGGGKDTVGLIIKCLTALHRLDENSKLSTKEIIDCIENGDVPYEYHEIWEVRKFADKLKQIASLLTGIPVQDFEKQSVKNSLLGEEWHYMSVRYFLQKLGTDAIRDNFHFNTWVNGLFCNYEPQFNWIITDSRFPNELTAVKHKDGICIKVERNSVETGDSHPSELAWRNWDFDYVIDNNGSLEDLVVQVKNFLEKFEIIK